jgi:putative oxidoreductase
MHLIFVIGRVLLVAIFIISGATKLLDISGTAAQIASVVTVPSGLSGLADQLQIMTGMTVPQILAILSGVIELVCGLLIAFNIGTRGAAFVLVLFTIVVTFYFHDFWNQTGPARESNMIHFLKNLTAVGGLLVFTVLGSWRPLDRQESV